MNTYIVAAVIYGILSIVGIVLSILISFMKCGKTSFSASTGEGLVWATVPSLLLLLTYWSPYVLRQFSEPMKMFSSALTQASTETLGRGYLMMLGGLVMTTRMVHMTDISVCKPSTAELAKFQDELMKELKKKEDDKEAEKPKE
jgi:hypothetical protein